MFFTSSSAAGKRPFHKNQTHSQCNGFGFSEDRHTDISSEIFISPAISEWQEGADNTQRDGLRIPVNSVI
jgi:hypothetical protein